MEYISRGIFWGAKFRERLNFALALHLVMDEPTSLHTVTKLFFTGGKFRDFKLSLMERSFAPLETNPLLFFVFALTCTQEFLSTCIYKKLKDD